MRIEKIPLANTNQYPRLLLDYLAEKENLKSFYAYSPNLSGLKQAIDDKSTFEKSKRNTLVKVLEGQYKNLPAKPVVNTNIVSLLHSSTFTVTTGHQLNIFSGPLYTIYKMASTINLANQLNKEFADKRIVPVYWMASEDHDFDEIAHFNFYDSKFEWEAGFNKAVGHIPITEMEGFLQSLPANLAEIVALYKGKLTLSEATRALYHHLFGDYGLVILDASAKELKASFSSIMEEDITKSISHKLVSKRTTELEKAGYRSQITSRPINFFYLLPNNRERIEKDKYNNYNIINANISFSKDVLALKLQEEPQSFSPNVVMRPLYQEFILPNIAYLGGPSEDSYWLQLKPVFDHYKVNFPVLLMRGCGLVIDSKHATKLDKLPFHLVDLLEDEHQLYNKLINHLSTHSLQFEDEKKQVKLLHDDLKERVKKIDPTLEKYVLAEGTRVVKSIAKVEQRVRKSEKAKHEHLVRHLEDILAFIFPKGNFQERYINLFSFYIDYNVLIELSVEEMNPLANELVVLIDE